MTLRHSVLNVSKTQSLKTSPYTEEMPYTRTRFVGVCKKRVILTQLFRRKRHVLLPTRASFVR